MPADDNGFHECYGQPRYLIIHAHTMDLPFGFPRYMEEQWDPFSGAADLSAFGNQIQQPRQAYQFQRHPAQGPQNHMDPSQGHPRYPYWSQSWMDACGQPPRAVVVNGGNIGGLHAPKQNEPKPRLSKEEVDSLEKEFLKNAKPNSSTKRELAERLQVEVPRINVCALNITTSSKLF